MTLALSPAARQAGYRLLHHPHVESTNTTALDLAKSGERGPLWVVADMQRAGKGSRNRSWISPPGNLYATLLLTDPSEPAHIAQLCFVAALALDDALAQLDGRTFARLRFKWPNDALLDGRKVSGTLVEATTTGSTSAAVIGIGVNVASHPEGMPTDATSLDEAGLVITRDALFERLSDAMVRALNVWNRGAGFTAIRAGWLSRAHGLGEPIALQHGPETIRGTFAGIDPTGQILIDLPGGMRRFASGEVTSRVA